VEVEFDPDLEPLGISGTFRGHDGLLKLIETFSEAWEQREVLPGTVVDMGDNRGVGLVTFTSRAQRADWYSSASSRSF
jgi:hypothetical protein